MVSVPIYPNLPYNQVSEILRRSGARAVFVADADQHAKIERAREALPELETVVVFDPWGLPEGTLDLAHFERRGEERLRILGACGRRHHQHGRIVDALITQDLLGELKTVHARHHAIEQHQVETGTMRVRIAQLAERRVRAVPGAKKGPGRQSDDRTPCYSLDRKVILTRRWLTRGTARRLSIRRNHLVCW